MVSWILGVTCGASAGECSKVYRMGWTDIPPAFYGNELRQPVGVDVEILDAVFERLGCRYEPRYMPFKRYIVSTEAGMVDLVLSASKNADRQSYAYFSVPYRRERMVAFAFSGNEELLKIRSLDDLARSSARVAAGIGMWLGAEFHARLESDPDFKSRVMLIEGYTTIVKALAANRVDVMVGDENGIHYLINKLGLQAKVVPLPVLIHENDVHFMFSKKTVPEEDVWQVDAVLRNFLGSTEHMEILARYPVGDPLQMLPEGVKPK
ncbi:MAG: transporter substrate-binding domain-containing protein [Alphaproteobacteria bacterium]|nr:transporter substrate-binding domain-containing protein [Alphaproteobacteria bacterium]